jgi:hypothetical protein
MTRSDRTPGPACVARTPGPAAAVVAAAAAVVTMIVATTAAAWAQASTTVATSTAPPGDPDPLNAGGIVFLGVSAIVFGGALLLYLRHRRPRVRS